jgi:hypothetical protein
MLHQTSDDPLPAPIPEPTARRQDSDEHNSRRPMIRPRSRTLPPAARHPDSGDPRPRQLRDDKKRQVASTTWL